MKVSRKELENHLRYAWWVYLLAYFVIVLLWWTVFQVLGHVDGKDSLNIVLVSDNGSADRLEDALKKRFGDVFQSIVVEQYSSTDPQLSQRLAVAVVDGRDLVILPASALREDTGDTFFSPLDSSTVEELFSGCDVYQENGQIYGIAIIGSEDAPYYLFCIGTSQNLAGLTSGEGDSRAIPPAQWIAGGGT